MSNPLPRYLCHKIVSAMKISSINVFDDGVFLYCSEPSVGPVRVDQRYIDQHKPMVGGYYVRYEDGYESWSPASAFESGYRRIELVEEGAS